MIFTHDTAVGTISVSLFASTLFRTKGAAQAKLAHAPLAWKGAKGAATSAVSTSRGRKARAVPSALVMIARTAEQDCARLSSGGRGATPHGSPPVDLIH